MARAQSETWKRRAAVFERAAALDLRSLALCRIATGMVILADLCTRLPSFRIHYTDEGILPRSVLYEIAGLRFPSAYAMSGWEPYLVGLFLLHALAGLSLAAGYRTRLSGALAWYLTLSLQERCFLANNGGDKVLATVLFWGLFLPWGDVLSVDSAGVGPPPEVTRTSMITAIFLLQPISIYLISVFHKLEPTWLRGQVLHYALQSDFYARPIAQTLLPYPRLMTILAFSTLAWEIVGPLLLFSSRWQLRTLGCVGLSLMHLAFGIFLRIGIFAFSPSVYMLGLLPSQLWATRYGKGLESKLTISFAAMARKLPATQISKPVSGRWVETTLAALFLYACVIALGQDKRLPSLASERFDALAYLTGLHQRWTVFVDTPHIFDGWIVVAAQLVDGRQVDLFQGHDPVTWDKPVTPYHRYTSFRWPTPLAIICDDPRFYKPFVQGLARDWVRDHPGDQIVWAQLNLFREQPRLDYRHSPVSHLTLWEGNL